MAKNDELIKIEFDKYNHFWIDSGLIGFYILADKLKHEFKSIHLFLEKTKVSLSGNKKDLIDFLDLSMETLLNNYYRVSNKNQLEKKEAIIFDSDKEIFKSVPRQSAFGIANLIYSGKSSALYGFIRTKGTTIVNNNSKYLQKKLTKFLQFKDVTKIPNDKIPIDRTFVPKPLFTIFKTNTKNNYCFICGDNTQKLVELKGTSFPLITGEQGAKSFFSFASKAENICWKCDYLSRFVPVNGFFKRLENEGLMTFFPYSNSLEKMWLEFKKLEVTKKPDEYYSRNFEEFLGGYFQKGYESSFSFFYTLYRKVLNTKMEDEAEDLDTHLLGDEFDNNLGSLFDDDFIDFYLLEVTKLGDSYIGKNNWHYNDSVYLFRLFKEIEINNNIRIKKVMRQLIDFEINKNQNKTLVRNKVCERILKKKKIINLVEPFVFTTNKSKKTYFRDLYNFTLNYENLIDGGNQNMDKKAREVAVKLGQQIGYVASDPKNAKRGKGDLFKLRKTRTVPDFLEEINRIQFRYNINITKNIYEGIITKENFKEFKQYVMIAALNTYNGRLSAKDKTSDK